MTKTEKANWINWGHMHPMVDPKSLDSVARAQIVAAQQNPNANRPIDERS
jgi:hypothetical protein